MAKGKPQPETAVTRRGAGEALVVRTEAREMAELQALMIVAHQSPRSEDECYEKIRLSVEIPAVAKVALYIFKRGETEICDISAVEAREIARLWKHIDYGFHMLKNDDEQISIEGYAIDLETGTRVTLPDTFDKLMERKKAGGGTYWVTPNERELRELVFSRGAKLQRNCILALIPPHIKAMVIEVARRGLEKPPKKKQAAKDERAPLYELIGKFKSDFGVSVQQIEHYIKQEAKKMKREDFVTLQGIYNSISEKNQTVDDVFGKSKGSGNPPPSEAGQGDLGMGNVGDSE